MARGAGRVIVPPPAPVPSNAPTIKVSRSARRNPRLVPRHLPSICAVYSLFVTMSAGRSLMSRRPESCQSKSTILINSILICLFNELFYRRQAHRGPDFSGYYCDNSTGDILCHERLAIMDLGVVQPIQGTLPTRQVREVLYAVECQEEEKRTQG